MRFVLQLVGALLIVLGVMTFGTARGGIHEVFGAVMGVGGFLMWGQSYLIYYAKRQSDAQEKLLVIWQGFEKSRKAAM